MKAKMFPKERKKLIRFLADNGIIAHLLPDADVRQKAQKVISENRLKNLEMFFLRKPKQFNKKDGKEGNHYGHEEKS